jgi:E3 ubiquitin-protein ligase HUWE1
MTTKDLNLKEPIQIHFIDEIAHDAGGVFREWYSCLYKQIFSEKNKFFIENNNNSYIKGTYLIYPKYNNMNLDYYDFFGKLSAKALIDHVNISQNLNRTVVKYLLDENVNLFDMQFYDIDIYNSLKEINDNDNINDNEILRDIKFVWNIKDENGNLKEIELVENGRNINLNNENKYLFIEKVIYYETLYNYEEQIERLKKGFFSLIGNKIYKIFQPEEFAYELSGQIEIDLEDWKNNTIYKGHYNKDNKTIKIFWEILSELSQNELFNFFHFCTSSIHVPIDGFNSLKGVNNKIQKFTIEPKLTLILDESNNSNFKLIEAKTCFNRILLPEYSSKEDMKKAIDIILGNDTSFFGLE